MISDSSCVYFHWFSEALMAAFLSSFLTIYKFGHRNLSWKLWLLDFNGYFVMAWRVSCYNSQSLRLFDWFIIHNCWPFFLEQKKILSPRYFFLTSITGLPIWVGVPPMDYRGWWQHQQALTWFCQQMLEMFLSLGIKMRFEHMLDWKLSYWNLWRTSVITSTLGGA